MFSIFVLAPILGILVALASLVVEQLLAIVGNIFFHQEIVLDFYANLNYFLVSAAVIEESLKFSALFFILRRIYKIRRFKFVYAGLVTGFFFGLTEIYLVLFTNGASLETVGTLDGDMLFSLLAILIIHVLTTTLIATLIASRPEPTPFKALRAIIPPTFIHLLTDFLVIQKSDFTNWLMMIVFGIVSLSIFFILLSSFRELD